MARPPKFFRFDCHACGHANIARCSKCGAEHLVSYLKNPVLRMVRMEAGDNALLCMRARARGESPAELVREAVKLYLMLGPEVPQ